jgi:predicted PurR-regulated permease PerM
LALYYFLADGPGLLAAAEALIPIEHAHQRQLAKRFVTTVRAVVFATFLAALGQGLATAIALKIVGFDHFLVLIIVSTFAALIPMAGTWLVWCPCAAWLAYQGHWVSASFLAIVGALVIGMLDNVIRTVVLQNDTKLHPLLAFVSVMGGLQVMGLWGVFIGPIVACCLHALIQIFNEELNEIGKATGLTLGLAGETAQANIADQSTARTGEATEAASSSSSSDTSANDSPDSKAPESGDVKSDTRPSQPDAEPNEPN